MRESGSARGSTFSRLKSSVVSLLVSVYILGVFVSAPYYNWQYAKENGFVKLASPWRSCSYRKIDRMALSLFLRPSRGQRVV